MNCMKCGREVDEKQAFCSKCLEQMEQYPVRHDVVVTLPNRQPAAQKKAPPRKRARTPEEQVVRLKRINRRLAVVICLLLAALAISTSLSIDYFRQLDVQKFLGQNYSTVETID